jgi:hypothetical protein
VCVPFAPPHSPHTPPPTPIPLTHPFHQSACSPLCTTLLSALCLSRSLLSSLSLSHLSPPPSLSQSLCLYVGVYILPQVLVIMASVAQFFSFPSHPPEFVASNCNHAIYFCFFSPSPQNLSQAIVITPGKRSPTVTSLG